MSDKDMVELVRNAIWREDHYDPKLCSHGGEGGATCPYCEPHDDDTPAEWPADLERAERQARAAIATINSSGNALREALDLLRECRRMFYATVRTDRCHSQAGTMIAKIDAALNLSSEAGENN